MERIPPREIEYTPDFKEVIAQNPGALKSFLKLEKEIEEKAKNRKLDIENEESFSDGDVRATPVYSVFNKIYEGLTYEDCDVNTPADYLKVEIGDNAYFVKRDYGFHWDGSGIQEMNSLKKAKEVLKDMQGVEVVDFQLGYCDDKNRKSYFVSKWMDLPTVREASEENVSVLTKFNEINKKLSDAGFIDAHEKNMFYDKTTDTIYVFDVFDREGL